MNDPGAGLHGESTSEIPAEAVASEITARGGGSRLFGTVGQANYGAAKAGIVSLTTIAALEMARYGVTANAISPIAHTRMTDGIAGGAGAEPGA